MSLRAAFIKEIAEAAPVLRAAGARRVEWHADGSIVAEFGPPLDVGDTTTIPPPPATISGVRKISEPFADPHPEIVPEDEPASEAIARELLALDRFLASQRQKTEPCIQSFRTANGVEVHTVR